ncbi:Fe-S cluster assembly protein SufD [Pseudohongiella sp.]|uniref:FeS assembly protein SufD n=1 Tax=marine sediment metagenome TaxID=412755 RepID=A0A0F9W3M4_9ZZZZ|nr:Fe-S cluster assembly protein SufD [Pseudohongiella sp.]HDZ09608.1 Fe-S cluster assembly protein SufD [Pseudohongiella sp.]HEA62523.1 Fe-S cluster assembly protein SufD [Pseudohongiella sp.]
MSAIATPAAEFQKHALTLAAAQSATIAQHNNSPAWMTTLREQGAADFARTPWPGRKTEQWKYTSLQSLQDFVAADWGAALVPAAGHEAVTTGSAVSSALLSFDATRLVFVDGVFDARASDALPSGMTLFSLADDAASKIIADNLGRVAGSVDAARRNLFSMLNNAWTRDGLLVHLPRSVTLEKPLYIAHVSSAAPANTEATVANQRVLVVMEEGSSAQIVEHYIASTPGQAAFVNALTEIQLGNNASLHHTRLNMEDEALSHVGAVHLNLQRDARFHGFTIAEGSRLKRIDYQMNHCGQGAELNLDGVYLARNKQLVDYHTTIEHRVPNGTSKEVFRGIIGDKARAVFNGRIHIHKDAQKTLAELNNRNLLTSNSAEIDTKPELEIYADDVRCAHGATISQLDETALYYLQSRGISPAQARVMLSFGFINELLQGLPHEDIKTALGTHLSALFAADRAFVSDGDVRDAAESA